MKLKTFNYIQIGAWLVFIIFGLGMGYTDLIMRSFYPTFNGDNFALSFFSLFFIMLVVISNPLAYKWFDK
jgi:hypothetical protein